MRKPRSRPRDSVTVQDLPETAGPIFLYCRSCHERASATRGDYFLAKPSHVLRHCGKLMILARAVTHIVRVAL